MKKTLFCILLFFPGIAAIKAQTVSSTYSDSLTSSSPTFNRTLGGSPPTGLSGVGTMVFYKAIPITISMAGTYRFTSNYPNTYDAFGIFYDTSGFNSASPLTNALVANDDSVSGHNNFSISLSLVPGTYTLVSTAYDNAKTGNFTITAEGPAAVLWPGATPLPLDLLRFSAGAFDGYNRLEWETANEKNTAFFGLQRSTDGREYATIANIDAKSNGAHQYTYRDNEPAGDVCYYRLKMTDKNDAFSFSATQRVVSQQRNSGGAVVLPNPAKGQISLTVAGKELLGTQAAIINLNGQTLQSFTIDKLTMTLDIAPLPAGIYIIRFASGKLVKFSKLD